MSSKNQADKIFYLKVENKKNVELNHRKLIVERELDNQ